MMPGNSAMDLPAGGKILVWLPNWVGDVVMATPALRAMVEHFDGAAFTITGRPVALDVLSGIKWAEEMIPDTSRLQGGVRSFAGFAWQLRKGGFDLAVLLPNSFRTAALARLAGVGRIAGYERDGRGWLLSDKLSPARDSRGGFLPVPTIDYYLDLVGMLGVKADSRRMELAVLESDDAAAEDELARAGCESGREIVILNPGASFGPSKLWLPARFAEVADQLVRRRDARIIINAAPSERRIAAEVQAHMKCEPAISFAERDNSIGLLKALIKRCSLLITNDTGVRHFAAAFDVGVVTLFGSTDPVWAQIDYPRERIVRVAVPCSPCQQKICPQPAGPMYHHCMSAITPEMVLAAAEELLCERAQPEKAATS